MMKQQKDSSAAFFDAFSKHPFIFVTLICAMVFPFGYAQKENLTVSLVIVEAIIWIVCAMAFVALCRPGSRPAVNVGLIITFAVLIIAFSFFAAQNSDFALWMFAPVLVGVICLGAVLAVQKKLTADRVVLMLILLGVVVRYCYCLKYGCTEMQHDIGTFDGKHGHLAYINYWYENGLTLPDFNVTSRWQFYHPPLHHMLMALLLRVFTFLGMPLEQAHEAIQILPMLYSSLCMAVCYRIFKQVKLGGAGLVVAMTGVCFYPAFIIWSGAYNNDILTTLLMLSAVLWTLKWAQKPSLLRILAIALCVGCGMMSKLSAWMVAPGIALVFIWVFIKNIKKPLRFIGQFFAFGAVCAPLALWWEVRSLLKFNVPLTYVPDPNMSAMSLKAVPLGQRLIDFSASQFSYPYEAFTMYGAPYNEYNPLMGLLKTSLFDEFNENLSIIPLMTGFLIFAAVLLFLCVVGFVIMLIKKQEGMDVMTKLFFVVLLLTIIGSYYLFCFRFPYVCTENIRYCIPVIPILSMGAGFGVNAFFCRRKTNK